MKNRVDLLYVMRYNKFLYFKTQWLGFCLHHSVDDFAGKSAIRDFTVSIGLDSILSKCACVCLHLLVF